MKRSQNGKAKNTRQEAVVTLNISSILLFLLNAWLYRHGFYNVSGSKFAFFHQKSPQITVFAVDKRLQSAVTCKNLFFASFLEVSDSICVHFLRFRNKFLPFVL